MPKFYPGEFLNYHPDPTKRPVAVMVDSVVGSNDALAKAMHRKFGKTLAPEPVYVLFEVGNEPLPNMIITIETFLLRDNPRPYGLLAASTGPK